MKRLIIFSALGTLALSSSAERLQSGTNIRPTTMHTRAAGCPSAQATKVMEFNNVSALIAQGGLNFLDRSINRAAYEVPKNSNARAIYGNSLWMAGVTGDDVLKAATIVAFRTNGEEFWPGPLSNGPATVDEATCVEYDRFYYANRSEVLAFYNDFLADGAVSTIPTNIAQWPAFGPNGEKLAPFYDADGDELTYSPENGDMPWFQFKKTATELPCGNDRTVTLYGDQNYWWVFNDNGNAHTESGGLSIGMEIHAQAFAFNTDDEVNDMTFYNYLLINRSTQTLFGTYFGNFFDCDLGFAMDDYTGCDVSRGLGYVYNGDNYDQPNAGADNYGFNPPAIGVDYFEGPYQDDDGVANQIITDYNTAIAAGGIAYKGIGIGYDDDVIDNERFGMRKFMTYTGTGAPNTNMSDPDNAPHAYNYLLGLWRDGSQPCWGGSGYPGLAGVSSVAVDYMYYYNTDPYFWASRGTPTDQTPGGGWREDLHGNVPADRRFIESSGPFTLEPGAENNITIGVVYARTPSGIPFNSVDPYLYRADDKAQALFDNCFKILEGPPAPDVTVQELENEIILMLTNSANSTNYKEKYSEPDPFIILPDEAPFNDTTLSETEKDSMFRSYAFEGYKIFQLANGDIKSGDLDDPDKARQVAQVDLKNGIKQLINWNRDPSTGYLVPTLEVDGADVGIKHSFRFTSDAFTQARLVNHKSYYYMAVAYAYNEYKKYDPTSATDGQLKSFIQSRKDANGNEVPSYVAIPHIPVPENGGTSTNAVYGDGPIITRVEGRGNGGLDMKLLPESETEIVNNNFSRFPKYYGGEGSGPIEVKVIDPLNLTNHKFKVVFNPDGASLNTATWTLIDLTTGDQFESDQAININNEQIFPQYGFSVRIQQWQKVETFYDGSTGSASRSFFRSEVVRATLDFSSKDIWLSGIGDQEGNTPFNWVRSGTVDNAGTPSTCDESIYNDYLEYDPEGLFEKILGGTVAPYHLTAFSWNNGGTYCATNTPIDFDFRATITGGLFGGGALGQVRDFGVKTLKSVDIVITSDKSKWTRCPVFETTDNPSFATNVPYGQKQIIKELPSRDKNGNVGDGIVSGDPNDADFIAATGMSWFPGYVIDVETGVRLNVGFGEDSRYPTENGKDMMWNPTSNIASNMGDLAWGGKHYLYIFNNTIDDPNYTAAAQKVPAYDYGKVMSDNMRMNATTAIASVANYWRACSWVWCPVVNSGYNVKNPATDIPTDVRMTLRVKKPYERLNTSGYTFNLADAGPATNNWNNVYEFDMGELVSETNNTSLNDSILSLINVVPNPYYAYSQYEKNRLDNRIKIVNLPDDCTIRIYNISGGLIRTLTKSTSAITSIDWDLKNQNGVPIAGGVYLIHVDVPNVGERVLKWFGALRPADLDNF